MRFHILAVLPICVSALVTFPTSYVVAAGKDESYSTYVAQNQVTEAILSRDGTTFMTFATERGRTVLRGWRISGNDATPVGRIEFKEIRTPTRKAAPYPYSDVNKDFASFKKTFALSPDGNRIARVECMDIDAIPQCQRLSILDWRGKTVKDIKDKKKDGVLLQYTGNVPGAQSCGLEFSPNGERLYFCSEGAQYSSYTDIYSRIHVYDAQLRKLSAIDLGPIDRPAGEFPGRALIERFQISRDNKMLVSGLAYASNNQGAPGYNGARAFDSSRGNQIWRIDLTSGKVEYHYAPTRAADAENYQKTGNYLAQGSEYHAVLVGPHLLRAYTDSILVWEGEVFGESTKPMPEFYGPEYRFTRVSDDGRVLFGERHTSLLWMIVGRGAGPVQVHEEYLPRGESVLALTLAPETYKAVIVTNRDIVTYETPAPEAITTAEKYAKGIELIETGFIETGVKEIKETLSTMPPTWRRSAYAAIYPLLSNVIDGKKDLPLAQMGEILRHAADVFYASRGESDAESMDRALSTWIDFGLLAAQARNPIVVRQVADKIERMIPEWQATRVSKDTNRDAYNSVPLMLRGLATAIEKSPDSAYDYLLTGGGLKDNASVRIATNPRAAWPLYANLTKLAYLTGRNTAELERIKPKTPPSLTPVPYPDVDGKLIPALTIYGPGAVANAAAPSQPGNSVLTGTVPPPAALGAQVLD
jgi:hypothetical protein